MSNVRIWELLDIHNLEKVLSEHLALKTAQLAQQMKSKKYDFIHGPLGKKWDKKLRKNNDIEELNALRELLITVREAKKAGMQCCDSYQCETNNMIDERFDKYIGKFDSFDEKGNLLKISDLLYTFLDLFKSFYKPNEDEALIRTVEEMKKLNDEAARLARASNE